MSEFTDTYYTVAGKGEAIYREKASKFIGLAFPAGSETEVMEILQGIRKKYHDANHHCFSYCLGPYRKIYRFNDDGEPSGSAGRPIYGQLLSRSVTDTLVIVVRYFGGTKLGIPGLFNAYRQAAADALDNAGKTEKLLTQDIEVRFPYMNMNDVMRIQKEEELGISDQRFDGECRIILSVRKSKVDRVLQKLMRFRNISTLVHVPNK